MKRFLKNQLLCFHRTDGTCGILPLWEYPWLYDET